MESDEMECTIQLMELGSKNLGLDYNEDHVESLNQNLNHLLKKVMDGLVCTNQLMVSMVLDEMNHLGCSLGHEVLKNLKTKVTDEKESTNHQCLGLDENYLRRLGCNVDHESVRLHL